MIIVERSKHWNLHISRCAPECPRDPPEPLVCSDYERCRHCSYMAHGFRCDHGNGITEHGYVVPEGELLPLPEVELRMSI